jgi:hypothetical protein
MCAMSNEWVSKPAQRNNILAHTGGSTLDNWFFASVTAYYTAKGDQKRIGKEGNHGFRASINCRNLISKHKT